MMTTTCLILWMSPLSLKSVGGLLLADRAVVTRSNPRTMGTIFCTTGKLYLAIFICHLIRLQVHCLNKLNTHTSVCRHMTNCMCSLREEARILYESLPPFYDDTRCHKVPWGRIDAGVY